MGGGYRSDSKRQNTGRKYDARHGGGGSHERRDKDIRDTEKADNGYGQENQMYQQPYYEPSYPPTNYDSGTGVKKLSTPNPSTLLNFEIDTLHECKRLWLEYTRHTLSVFAKNSYQYNVYESKKNRFLIVSPTTADFADKGRGKSQPTDFSVHSAKGKEIFIIKWRPGTCFNPGVHIDVFFEGSAFGSIHQEQGNMIARNVEGTETLRVMSVPVLNVCNQRGPDSFRCEINMKGYSDSVGIIGRNGAIMENVIVGEPSGFYFICAKNPSNLEFTLMQKQYILAIMMRSKLRRSGCMA